MAIIQVKNNTAAEKTWVGQAILPGEYYVISAEEQPTWRDSDDVFASVGADELIVNNGSDDIENATDGWEWLQGDTTHKSYLGNKMAVHASSKPEISGKDFYQVWMGAGDDVVNHQSGEGETLQFVMVPGVEFVTKKLRFDTIFGDIYIHEGYLKWNGGGIGDHMGSDVIAEAGALQQAANLDLIIEDNWVKYSTGGPGTGTHGFGGNPTLIKRSYSKDGDWNYDENGLTPNFTGTGLYKISDIDIIVHRYFNNILTFDNSYGYLNLDSSESAWIAPGYYIAITAHNVSNGTWNAEVIIEAFRERTYTP